MKQRVKFDAQVRMFDQLIIALSMGIANLADNGQGNLASGIACILKETTRLRNELEYRSKNR